MSLALGLGFAAGLCGIAAAVCAFKASTIKAEPSWEGDPSLRPNNMQQHLFGMTNALDAQQFWAGRWNRRAAIFAAIGAVLGLAAWLL